MSTCFQWGIWEVVVFGVIQHACVSIMYSALSVSEKIARKINFYAFSCACIDKGYTMTALILGFLFSMTFSSLSSRRCILHGGENA